jgi:dTDP-4-amino-4,6-dideoxygalactose transaminase
MARRQTFLPFSPPDLSDSERNEVLSTLNDDWITTGPRTKRFEEELASFVVARAAIAVNSYTAATMAAPAAHGIGPGTRSLQRP